MRPSRGTVSGRVWDLADQLSGPGAPAHRADVVAGAAAEGIDAKTASTQFGAWKRAMHPEFDGILRTRGKPTESLSPAAAPAATEDAPGPDRHWASLLKNGFRYGPDWQGDAPGELRLDRPTPDQPGVYVFVENDHVVCVGTTRRRLADRMRDCRIGHAGQTTSARIKGMLPESLAAGNALRVLFAMPGLADWNGLPVELAAGLEAGLLTRFQPAWNRKGLT